MGKTYTIPAGTGVYIKPKKPQDSLSMLNGFDEIYVVTAKQCTFDSGDLLGLWLPGTAPHLMFRLPSSARCPLPLEVSNEELTHIRVPENFVIVKIQS